MDNNTDYINAHLQIIYLLRKSLADARVRNPRYSLRASARRLGLPPSMISEYLLGRRRVTRNAAIKILPLITSDTNLISRLIEALPAKQTRSRIASAEAKTLKHYTLLTQSQFNLVSEWYHFAILALMETRNFSSRPSWIASRLKITEAEVRKSKKVLLSLQLITVDGTGQWHLNSQRLSTPTDIPNPAIRLHHSQGLDLAKNALESVPVELREFGASTIAIDPRTLPKVKKKLQALRRSIAKELEMGEKQEVYRLSIELFPLTAGAIGPRE